jgi:hypothetical protein
MSKFGLGMRDMGGHARRWALYVNTVLARKRAQVSAT